MKLTSIFLPFVLFTTGGIFLYAVLYGYFAYQAAIASPRFLSILFLLLISLAVSWESTKKKKTEFNREPPVRCGKVVTITCYDDCSCAGFFVGECIDKGVGKIIDLGSIKEKLRRTAWLRFIRPRSWVLSLLRWHGLGKRIRTLCSILVFYA